MLDCRQVCEQTLFVDIGSDHPLVIGSQNYILCISLGPAGFEYVLWADGQVRTRIPEMLEGEVMASKTTGRVLGYEIDQSALKNTGEPVVIYEIILEIEFRKPTIVHRRFREIAKLFDLLKSACIGRFDMDGVVFPERLPKVLTDHADTKFLSQRAVEISSFLEQLGRFPMLLQNPDFIEFTRNNDLVMMEFSNQNNNDL